MWHKVDFDNIRTIANNLSEESLGKYNTDTSIEMLSGHILRISVESVFLRFQLKSQLNVLNILGYMQDSHIKKQRLYNKARLTGDSNDFHVP